MEGSDEGGGARRVAVGGEEARGRRGESASVSDAGGERGGGSVNGHCPGKNSWDWTIPDLRHGPSPINNFHYFVQTIKDPGSILQRKAELWTCLENNDLNCGNR